MKTPQSRIDDVNYRRELITAYGEAMNAALQTLPGPINIHAAPGQSPAQAL